MPGFSGLKVKKIFKVTKDPKRLIEKEIQDKLNTNQKKESRSNLSDLSPTYSQISYLDNENTSMNSRRLVQIKQRKVILDERYTNDSNPEILNSLLQQLIIKATITPEMNKDGFFSNLMAKVDKAKDEVKQPAPQVKSAQIINQTPSFQNRRESIIKQFNNTIQLGNRKVNKLQGPASADPSPTHSKSRGGYSPHQTFLHPYKYPMQSQEAV